MFRNYRETNVLAQDGTVAQTSEETAFLGGQKSNGSPWSAERIDVDGSGQHHPSLFRCLVRVYGLSLLKAHLCKVVCDVLLFVGPVLQKWVHAWRCVKANDADPEVQLMLLLLSLLFFKPVSLSSSLFLSSLLIGKSIASFTLSQWSLSMLLKPRP